MNIPVKSGIMPVHVMQAIQRAGAAFEAAMRLDNAVRNVELRRKALDGRQIVPYSKRKSA